MASPSFPNWISQVVQQSNYSEQREGNIAVFAPEVGKPKLRRRMSISQDVLTVEQWLSNGDYEDLKYFWRFTLKLGTLPFTWVHPRTKAAGSTFKFEPDQNGSSAPKIASNMGTTFVVQYSLRLISVSAAPGSQPDAQPLGMP